MLCCSEYSHRRLWFCLGNNTTMAFFGRLGNIIRQSANNQITSQLRSSPSVSQAIRCMSTTPTTKLFIGGEIKLPFKLIFVYMFILLCLVDSNDFFFYVCLYHLSVTGVSYSTDEQSLREAFARYGEVVDGKTMLSFVICNKFFFFFGG